MNWMNEPPEWRAHENKITIHTAPKTDFWRKTHYGFVRDNGHFYSLDVAGDFDLQVKVVGKYHDLYDQAGLMVRVDELNWIKTGIEFVNGVQQASAVVTRDFSDWSVAPLPSNPPAIWLRLSRRAEAIEIFYSLDGSQYELLRLAYLPPVEVLRAGLMCASPDGGGFDVVFEDFRLVEQP